MEQKLCKDCGYAAFKDTHFLSWRCAAPQNVGNISLVTGEQRPKHMFCYECRESSLACGRTGVWFRPLAVAA